MKKYFQTIPAIPVKYTSFDQFDIEYRPQEQFTRQQLFDLFWKPCKVKFDISFNNVPVGGLSRSKEMYYYESYHQYRDQNGNLQITQSDCSDPTKPQSLLTSGATLSQGNFYTNSQTFVSPNNAGYRSLSRVGVFDSLGESGSSTNTFNCQFEIQTSAGGGGEFVGAPLVAMKEVGGQMMFYPFYDGTVTRYFLTSQYTEYVIDEVQSINIYGTILNPFNYPKIGEIKFFDRTLPIYGYAQHIHYLLEGDGEEWNTNPETEEYEYTIDIDENINPDIQASISIVEEFQMSQDI